MRLRNRFAAGLMLASCATSASAVTLLTESFSGANGTQPANFSAFTNATINSQIDTGEYEQQHVAGANAFPIAIAFFNDANQTDQGMWRDVKVSTNTRFSGGADNRNGVILRASNVASVNTGDYYHVRFEGSNLVLYRAVNGVFTSLATAAITGSATSNRTLEVSIANIAQPDQDHVQIQARLFATGSTTNLDGLLTFTDTSADAITRAGTVGYRSFNTASGDTRSTYDNLSVTSTKSNLLWYDDYHNGTALRMQTFSNSGVSDGTGSVITEKYAFNHGTTSQTSLGLVNFDSATQDWLNVGVTSMMRINTNATNSAQLASGLVLRETDVASNVSNQPGEFYHYRLVRIENANQFRAELLRKDGTAGFQFLSTVNLTDLLVPESVNIFLNFSAVNEGTGVRLIGLASLNQDFSNPFGVINFLDTSANAITTAGSAGFRHFGIGSANFDNFTVTDLSIPEPASLTLLGLAGLTLMRRRRA